MANPELTPKWAGHNQRATSKPVLKPLAIVLIVILAIAVVFVAAKYKSALTGPDTGSMPLVEKKK